MEYRGYTIEQDKTGYAPKHLQFHFFELGDEIAQGSGESIEDCKRQIDEILRFETIRHSNYQQTFYDYNDPQ